MRLLEENIKSLTNYLKENITSSSAASISEKIKTAELILSDPSSLMEIEETNIKLLELQSSLIQLSEEIKVAENLIMKLKNYLQENITSELAPEIFEKVELLENSINSEDYNKLIKINEDTDKFLAKNNLKTKSDILAEKQAEEKRKEKEKRIIEEEKRIAEEIRKEKENEGKHFFTTMLCEQVNKSAPILADEEIAYYSALGIESENLYYINEIYPVKMCECFEEKTRKTINLERIKEINTMYKKNSKDPNITNNSREQNFFAGLGASCGNLIAGKMEFWMKGGRP